MENKLPSLSEIIAKQMLFFGRSDVQNQVLIIFLSLTIGWLLSKWIWKRLQKSYPLATVITNDKLSPRQYLAFLLKAVDFPIISLLFLNLSQILFFSQNLTRGLLNVAIKLVVCYLVYRCFLAILYATFNLKIIRQYHQRLFAPIFTLFVLRTFINLYNDIQIVSQVSPFKLFNTPLTLGAIFILLAGPYFCIVIVILIENLVFSLIHLKSKAEQGKTQATLLLIRYFFIGLGIVVILGYVGVDGKALATITGGLSVGIGFGLQQVVSNFVSGILLLFEKVLKPGDIISIEGQTSQVKKLGIRATTVQMLSDNSEKIIPNQTFFTQDVTTYTGSNSLVNCSITVGVSYSANPKQVMNLLIEIAQDHSQVLKNPEPSVFFLNFGDSSLNFEIKFWLDNVKIRKNVISDLNCSILDTFAQHNIEIPFPQRDIHIRK
jgi:small-conductance mechanosensitive channel